MSQPANKLSSSRTSREDEETNQKMHHTLVMHLNIGPTSGIIAGFALAYHRNLRIMDMNILDELESWFNKWNQSH
ncbi:hypothetical protein Tco_1576585 [Tanacetum coccineum]